VIPPGSRPPSPAELERSAGSGTIPAMIWACEATDPDYPEAWGGEIQAGKFAVRIAACQGITNVVMDDPD
jgi:hypothetical protein